MTSSSALHYRTTKTSDRTHVVDIGTTHHEIFLTNDQKQSVHFRVDSDVPDFEESISSQVILNTPLGRMVLDGSVTLAPEALDQVGDRDYSFFRHTPHTPTTIVLPPHVDSIGFHITSSDQGRTWLVRELVLFDQ